VAWDISSRDSDEESFYDIIRDICAPESLESLQVHEGIDPIFMSLIRTVRFRNVKGLFAVLNEDSSDWRVMPVRALNGLITRTCQGLEWLVLGHKHPLDEDIYTR
jgi:hypothetical protein